MSFENILAVVKVLVLPIIIGILLTALFVTYRETAGFLEFRGGRQRGMMIWRETLADELLTKLIRSNEDFISDIGFVRKTSRGWLVRGRLKGKVMMPIIGEIRRIENCGGTIEYRVPIGALVMWGALACTIFLAPLIAIGLVAQLWMYRRAMMQVLWMQ